MTRYRNIAPRWLVLASAIVAAALVFGALPTRREGGRISTIASIPMRQPTAGEAAELLRKQNEGTAIVSLSDDEVVIVTDFYVLPADSSEPERKYHLLPANWGGYYSRYEVPRAPLETALGRKLRLDEVQHRSFKVSFAPALVPLYVAVEIVFLTVWLSLALVGLQRTRRLRQVLLVAWLWLLIPFFFLFVYSPAFFDADFFCQRIVVEYVAVVGFMLIQGMYFLFLLSLPVLFALHVAGRIARRISKGGADEEARVRRYRKRTKLGIVALVVAFVLHRTWMHFEDRTICLAELSALESRLDAPTLAEALAMPPSKGGDVYKGGDIYAESVPSAVRAAVTRILAAPGPQMPGHDLQVYVRTGRVKDEVLLMRRSSTVTAIVQTLGLGFAWYAEPSFLEQFGANPITTTWSDTVFSGDVRCGKRIQVDGHEAKLYVRTR